MNNGKRQPHKHAELIKAWADGAEIQWRLNDNYPWREIKTPAWEEYINYRIKPLAPNEPDYARIAYDAWRHVLPGEEAWKETAKVVIEAKEAYDKALKEYQNV